MSPTPAAYLRALIAQAHALADFYAEGARAHAAGMIDGKLVALIAHPTRGKVRIETPVEVGE